MNAVGTADLRGVLKLNRPTPEHPEQRFDLPEQEIAGIAQQQGVGRIDHVGRRQTIVNKTRRFTDVFGEVCRKRDDVVVGLLLNLIDAFD